MSLLTIRSDGPRLIATDYWTTEHALRGAIYVSVNAGAFRVLLPSPIAESIVREIRTARDVVISRGPWPDAQREDALELLWDDGSDSPFALHCGIEQIDRLPLDRDVGSRWICTVWTEGNDGAPVERLSLPATYRRSARLPDLRPANP